MRTIENTEGDVIGIVPAAQDAAAIFQTHMPEPPEHRESKIISLRVPLLLLAQVQALANKGGRTRNYTMNTLLAVGFEEVTSRFDPEHCEHLSLMTSEQLDRLSQQEGF
jgi:hypothetical protein